MSTPSKFDAVSSELKSRSQWVVWRLVDRGNGPTKIPFQANGETAKSNDSSTWTTFDEAVKAFQRDGRNAGIGFVLSDDDPYCGVDLDGCLIDGQIADWAQPWLDSLEGGYAEVSPSGTGIKVITRGGFAGSGGSKKIGESSHTGIEIFCRGRFFAITGDVLGSPVETIADQQAAVDKLYAFIKPPVVLPAIATQPRHDGAHASNRGDKESRAAKWADATPGAISGENGHGHALYVACTLVHGFDLGVSGARPIYQGWNSKCQPPWSIAELEHKLNDAASKVDHLHPVGHMLVKDRPDWSPRWTAADAGHATRINVPVPNSTRADSPLRPVIEITNREYEVNRAVAAELAKHKNFYVFGTVPAEVIGESRAEGDVCDRYTDGIAPPCVRPIPEPVLRERISEVCDLHSWKPVGGELRLTPSHPPTWCVKAIAHSGEYPGVRPIIGVIETPTIRADGTILDQHGYDRSTRLFLAPSGEFPKVADTPTFDDAVAAMGRITCLVKQFPWRSDADLSVWVAALFTAVAREFFNGCAPLFGFDATAAGSGKTLLADVIAVSATGRIAPRLTVEGGPHADGEIRKKITSIALAGDRITLVDNVDVPLGGAALDAALTGSTWRDRILGQSQMTSELPLRTTWLASGNNLSLKSDMLRRTLISRIEPRVENPEERSGFDIPHLVAHVKAHRGEIVRDVLTVLRAWHLAGRPSSVEPLGSFEEWTTAIVNPIIWVGLANPLDVRAKTSEDDGQKSLHRGLIHGWRELPEVISGGCVSVAGALKRLKAEPNRFETLRSALLESSMTSDLPSAKSIGSMLRRIKGRVIDGYSLHSKNDRTGVMLWGITGREPTVQGLPENLDSKPCTLSGDSDNNLRRSAGFAGFTLPTRENPPRACSDVSECKTNPANPANPAPLRADHPGFSAQNPHLGKPANPSGLPYDPNDWTTWP